VGHGTSREGYWYRTDARARTRPPAFTPPPAYDSGSSDRLGRNSNIRKKPKMATTEAFTNPDGTAWDPPSRETMEACGNAPVKREFLRPLPPIPSDPKPPASDGSGTDGGTNGGKSKRAQKRDNNAKKVSVEHLCNAFAKGICTFGEKCRFSHDHGAYLLHKQLDLPGPCPFIVAKGKCPHGVMCRFYGTHPDATKRDESNKETNDTDDTDTAVTDAQSMADVLTLPPPTDGMLDEINFFHPNLKVLLRKGKIRFNRSDAVLKQLGVKTKWSYGPHAVVREFGKGIQVEDTGATETTYDPDTSHTNRDPSNPDTTQATGQGDDEGGGKRRKEDGASQGVDVRPRRAEKRTVDFKGKLYLAPLTTVGNLPFRRIAKQFGADITCGEMALCTNLLQGQPSEWALLRRHASEDVFGAQICGGYPDAVSRCAQLIDDEFAQSGGIDFVDINMGCPIDLICNKGAGSMLLQKPSQMELIAKACSPILSCALTLKTRTGYYDNKKVAHEIIPNMKSWGVSAVTLHGRSRQQRYSRLADWKYIGECVSKANALSGRGTGGGTGGGNSGKPSAPSFSVIGNGDVYSWHDYNAHCDEAGGAGVATCMIARGGLIKPWIFTEIKEQRDWDISSGERLDILKQFASFGLEHWGSDARGVANTRRFLLEWLSFLHRYIPVGLLERTRVGIHERPPTYVGRNDLETLFASTQASDWVKITTMLLGPTEKDFVFRAKHKSNAYATEGAAEKADLYGGDNMQG
jgi:tRNA-dihydrouridine synthase 3